MAKILITGARAPVALDWARNLEKFGHQVYVADSLSYPLARNTAAIIEYIRIPEPRTELQDYAQALMKLCALYDIDFILPTCEEVFYLSWLKPQLESFQFKATQLKSTHLKNSPVKTACQVICPDFDLIARLHSKVKFLEMAEGLGISIPKTLVLTGREIKGLTLDFTQYVIKKEFCRFGTDVKVSPKNSYIQRLEDEQNYLLQEKVSAKDSTELCSYGIAHNGKLLAHGIYEPTYRVKQSSGIYFKNVVSEQIFNFIQRFVQKHQYTGQLGFDFIVNGHEVTVLECNPRATSGLHLLTDQNLFPCLTGGASDCITPKRPASMIGAAMLLIAFPQVLFKGQVKQWRTDYRLAEDIIVVPDDNAFWLFQFKSIGELIAKALKRKISVREASTLDIEWDGEKMEKYEVEKIEIESGDSEKENKNSHKTDQSPK